MKSKKTTFNMIASKMPVSKINELQYGDFTINIKNTISLKDAIAFINYVVSTCTDEENADYSPELFDFAVRVSTLIYFAGIDAPKDPEKAYDVCYGTDLYHSVYSLINQEQHNELVTGAKENLDYHKDMLCSAAAVKAIELIDKMDTIVSKGAEAMDKLNTDEFVAKLDSVTQMVQGGNNAPNAVEQNDEIIMLPRPEDME